MDYPLVLCQNCQVVEVRKRDWIYAGLVLAAGIGLVSCAASQEPSPPPLPGQNTPPLPGTQLPVFPPIHAGDRLLLIGDSLAQGLALPLKKLSSESGVLFFSDGKQSTTINQWANSNWLKSDLLSFRPNFILISLGTNDMKLFDSSSENLSLQNLVSTLRASKSVIIWLAPPTMPFPDNGIRKMILNTGVLLFASDSLVIPRGSDKIHPTASGYAGWAGAIWQFLLSGGKGSKPIQV